MIKACASLILLLVATCLCSQASADALLNHDPFARPLLPTLLPNNPATVNAEAEAEVETPWNPQLIAVMVSGKNSLVNLDGVILKIGEEMDGYRFVQAKDHEVVFKKGNKRIVLNMEISTLRKNRERGGE
jgi:hypothetical protein